MTVALVVIDAADQVWSLQRYYGRQRCARAQMDPAGFPIDCVKSVIEDFRVTPPRPPEAA